MSNSRALPSLIVCALLATGAASRKDAPLRELTADAVVVKAIQEQNGRDLSLVVLKVVNQRWMLGKESGLARQVVRGACADRMRDFLAANPAYREAFVLDVHGAVVCAAERPMTYWYGEEPRWAKSVAGEEFRSKEGLVSIPVVFEDKPIGVITAKRAR
jgi:hypothetical protein